MQVSEGWNPAPLAFRDIKSSEGVGCRVEARTETLGIDCSIASALRRRIRFTETTIKPQEHSAIWLSRWKAFSWCDGHFEDAAMGFERRSARAVLAGTVRDCSWRAQRCNSPELNLLAARSLPMPIRQHQNPGNQRRESRELFKQTRSPKSETPAPAYGSPFPT
jgi:hypothetical protein